MRYYIRNFTKLKQVISTDVLGKTATKYMADYYTKKFFFEKHLNFLLIFQLTCKDSMTEAVLREKTNILFKNLNCFWRDAKVILIMFEDVIKRSIEEKRQRKTTEQALVEHDLPEVVLQMLA